MTAKTQKKILLVDGHALLFRAFHAIPGLANKDGFPTGAIFGFLSIFLRALAQIKPSHVAVAFDLSAPTYRHKLSGDYKANRKETPEDLLLQAPKVMEILSAMEIPIYQKPGYEADDLIGIITKRTPQDMHNIVLTGDMDFLQLINDKTSIYRLKTGISDFVVYDEPKMVQEYGLVPGQWVDYKALRGDPSDNIPGVPGIGEKTALDLLHKFGSLDGVYKAVEKNDPAIKPAALKKLQEGKHYAYLSQRLAVIDGEKYKFDEFKLGDTAMSDYDQSQVIGLLQEMGIKSLIPKLPKTKGPDGVQAAAKPQVARNEKFETVDSADKLEALVKLLAKKKEIAVDVLRTPGPPFDSQMVGLSLAVSGDEAYYLPILAMPDLPALEKLSGILANPKIEKWGNGLKSDALVLRRHGAELSPFSFDTNIAAYLINPGQRAYDTESLSFGEFGMRMHTLTDYAGKPKEAIPFEKVPVSEAAAYSCEDATANFRLKDKLEHALADRKLAKIFNGIEMPLGPVLLRMEELGIMLDKKYITGLADEAGKQIAGLEKKIKKMVGYDFNISSPAQLRDALFGKLQIPTTELRRRGKDGGLSTAASELEKLRDLHPVIDLVFEYRELTKLKSTYLDALPGMVSGHDNRLHTTYNQTIAATGRLSSTDPNLQNIPIRTEIGRAIRKGFVAAPGFVLAAVDYSQIELRIAASLSGDPEMIKIFKSGKDFHQATAARIFGVMESAVTPEQRRAAKTINFSVLYGVSAFGLSERSDMGRAEAGEFIKRYYQVFAKLKGFIDGTIEQVRKDGFVANPLGRVRHFPEINAQNFAVRAAAERAAFNMPMQSLQADIIKMAMLEISDQVLSDDCRMLLQVHDELVFEVRKGQETECTRKIKSIMEKAYKLKVPIVAEAKIGRDWLDMKPL